MFQPCYTHAFVGKSSQPAGCGPRIVTLIVFRLPLRRR